MPLRINTKNFRQFASVLGGSGAAMTRASYRTLNKVADKWKTRSRREITSRVRLTPSYVRERMAVQHATPSSLTAIIKARVRGTRLATYGAKQLTRAAKTAKGDAIRAIPAGKKQAGVSVGVKRDRGRSKMRGAFMVPLKRGKEVAGSNGMGVFLRIGKGRKDIKHLYGPSVDQAFRWVIDDTIGAVRADMRETFEKQSAYEFRRIIK